MKSLRRLRHYPLSTQRQALKTRIAQLYRESLYLTCKDLLEYSDITHFTHDPIIRVLESPKKRKLICVPRGCFKSSIGVVGYSVWLLLRDPNHRILIDSELYENSKNFIREIKGKLELPRITMLFGEFKGSQWAEGNITIKQRRKIFKESSITSSGVNTGKTSQHYDTIIHDDLNSIKNSETKEQREKVIDHYRLNTSILEPEGTMVLIGTRYSADDILGWVIENEINSKGLIPTI